MSNSNEEKIRLRALKMAEMQMVAAASALGRKQRVAAMPKEHLSEAEDLAERAIMLSKLRVVSDAEKKVRARAKRFDQKHEGAQNVREGLRGRNLDDICILAYSGTFCSAVNELEKDEARRLPESVLDLRILGDWVSELSLDCAVTSDVIRGIRLVRRDKNGKRVVDYYAYRWVDKDGKMFPITTLMKMDGAPPWKGTWLPFPYHVSIRAFEKLNGQIKVNDDGKVSGEAEAG